MRALVARGATAAGGDAHVADSLFVQIGLAGRYLVKCNDVNGRVNGVEMSQALDWRKPWVCPARCPSGCAWR